MLNWCVAWSLPTRGITEDLGVLHFEPTYQEGVNMTNIKILERIDNLIDKMEYKTAYIEIQAKDNKYILEKEKNNRIGFEVK